MRDDPETTSKIKQHCIVQVVPEADQTPGQLLVVEIVESWGVIGRANGQQVRRPWSLIEDTGGTIVFDGGKRIRPPAPGRHHP